MTTQKRIRLLSHFPGSAEVSAPAGFKLKKTIAPPGSELEPPTALRTMDPGKLLVLKGDRSDSKGPLVLASKGRKADLRDKQDLIESAERAGRQIEIHVFDDLP